jgi:quinol monooxygenase YgiN
MIALIATMNLVEGKEAEFEAVFKKLAARVREEPGNLCYQLCKSRGEGGAYKVLEMYQDEAALAAHRNGDHLKAFRPELGATMNGPPHIETLDGVE